MLELFFFSGKGFGNHICTCEFHFRYEGSIQPESLKILLEFTLARGNLTSLFKVLKLLYGKEHKYIAIIFPVNYFFCYFTDLSFLLSFGKLP